MPNTMEEVLAYAHAHPLRDGKSWNGWCESFIWRAGGFTRSFPTALAAGDASGPLNKDWEAAPVNAIHYWAGVGGDGHVAFSLGNGWLLMASGRVSNMGTALVTIHFSNYNLPLYRGWTMRHGTQTLDIPVVLSAVATTNTTPLEEDDMYELSDRARDDVAAWQVGQIKAWVDEQKQGKGAIHTKLDLLLWATNDPIAGLRKMVAALKK